MALSDANRERVPDAVLHPLVRTHPESGRRSIYLNPIRTEGIVGMEESDALACWMSCCRTRRSRNTSIATNGSKATW